MMVVKKRLIGLIHDHSSLSHSILHVLHQARMSTETLHKDVLLDLTERQAYDLLLVINNAWDHKIQQQANAYSITSRTPLLTVYREPGKLIIGPLVLPDRTGCITCVDIRRKRAFNHEHDFTLERTLPSQSLSRSDASSGETIHFLALSTLAFLVQREVEHILHRAVMLQTFQALLYLDLQTLRIQRHPFLPDTHCPNCNQLSDDTAEGAILRLRHQEKIHPYVYRTRGLTELSQHLINTYVDGECGMIPALSKNRKSAFSDFISMIGIPHVHQKEVGYGRAFNFAQARVSSIAEALERYAGARAGGKRTVVRASKEELGDSALDPEILGLYTEEQYHHLHPTYVPYHATTQYNWVWGFSFREQRPLLVPEKYVYYGLRRKGDPPFVYEISNGCALGNTMEEAILHGILELAERDAFLMTWYARLKAPLLDPSSAQDPTIVLMYEKIYHITGYSVYAYNITLEQGIPCVWVMAVDERNREMHPKVICAAGSHLHPEKALINALQELSIMVQQHIETYKDKQVHAQTMLDDSSLVKHMEDHSILYCLPDSFERLHFLYQSSQTQSFAEAFPDFYQQTPHLDLLADVEDLLQRYIACSMDVIIVDQTPLEHQLAPFTCVKVLIPGLLPMTFGHKERRIHNLPRLFDIPCQLGYTQHPLCSADINLFPHPFP